MDHRRKSSLECDYALALEYSRVADMMMRTVASKAICGSDSLDTPDRYVPLKFMLDFGFLASRACSRAECRAKYLELVNDFSHTMAEIYRSKRDRMEDNRSWTGFTDLWSEWFEIKVLLVKLRSALLLYDLRLPVAVTVARKAGDQVLQLCPRMLAPVIPIRPSL